MQKLLLLLSFFLFSAGIEGICQSTATDFTATDCSGTSHTLFTELNAGKIIVLVWIEPCVGCISDSKAGYDAALSFATSHPGRVSFWLTDDVGNNDCTSLSSWASNNGIPPININIFDNTGNVIDESNYGGLGMPHVVVLGDTTHFIYYNKISGTGDGTDISNAITVALSGIHYLPEQVTNSDIDTKLKLSPNPATDKISVSYHLQHATTIKFTIYDIMGNMVQTTALTQQLPGDHTNDVHFANQLANGLYLLRLETDNGTQTVRFMIGGNTF